MSLPNNASKAVLAKARALYGRRLTGADYARLASCHSMAELAAALQQQPLYQEALADINPALARRAHLEGRLRQSVYARYDSLCRFDMSAGDSLYRYFTTCCEIEELLACLRCLDGARPGDYLFRLPDFLQKRCRIDLYALAAARDAAGVLAAVAGTPYAKVLAPLAAAAPGKSLLLTAEPLLMDYRHKALVALAPPKKKAGTAVPGVREYVELSCDIDALSNAGRLIRMHAPRQVIDEAARRDCTALTRAQWQTLLDSPDRAAYQKAVDATLYGPKLARYQYASLKDGLQRYQRDWCRKWLRFSTDPTMVMLCYTTLAKCEVTNLNRIIEGVHYGMPASSLLPLLVGWEETEGSVN